MKKGNIKTWAEQDRPREKLASKGASGLTDGELLAILIGNGTIEHSAVDIAQLILKSVDNDINKLGKLSIKDFTKVKGVGPAKAITLIAALELGRRRSVNTSVSKPILKTSNDAYEFLKPNMLDLKHEEFWIILLSRKLELIKSICISKGGITGTVADPKIIFKHALENECTSLILAHNHPSGSLIPSDADKSLTIKLKSAGSLLDIRVVDHIIFTDKSYFSFADGQLI